MTTERRDATSAATPLRLASPLPLRWSAGHEYLLVAVRLLIDDGLDVACWLPERGPETARVRYTIHDLGLREVVRLAEPGTVDVSLATPLIDDEWPEVARLGTAGPTVVTDLPRLRRRVGTRPDLRLVPRRDPVALATAIADVGGRVDP